MASRDLNELLRRAAPTPGTTLDIGDIERRALGRRRRRGVTSTVAGVLVVVVFTGLITLLPGWRERTTVVAGPPPRTIPIEFRSDTATTEIGLLDGTRLRWTLPEVVGRGLAGATFASLDWHGSVYADRGGSDRPPLGWRIDVTLGSIDKLVPRGDPLAVPPASGASAATVDHPGRRLALQFGSWALVASGDSLTDADISTLLTGVDLAETPDGFVEYRGSLPLWTIDDADARLNGPVTSVSLFLGDSCSQVEVPRVTASGLDSYRSAYLDAPLGNSVQLCDRNNRLRLDLRTSRPVTDEEVDRVRIEVVKLGATLAARQRGEWP